ncbi:uncharacterized protein IUM83_13056 [Phytophthora cinnamomi]|uniref:uncharacterized protein n=1 Tax=Phytophthora cinnamomi TaxID=4785 RepID=UPI00355AB022|nr:hypothetical protein IUM83_13056 [Phytophthora cinnamomi]
MLLEAKEITERLLLPAPPERHPSRPHAKNCFNADDPYDPEQIWQVRRLIDRYGEPPDVAFLVEWETDDLQLTWEWPGNLEGVYWCMNQINQWIESGKRVTFTKFFEQHFRGAGASKTILCFLYSFQAACYGLDWDGLVNHGHWDRFCRARNSTFPCGVLTRDIDAFFNYVRGERVPLDYVSLFKVFQKSSMTTPAELERKALELPSGCYIVHAAQHFVEHCFTLVVTKTDSKQSAMIYDAYDDSADPPCKLEPVRKLGWLNRVYAIYRIAPAVPKVPKKSKMSKKQRLRKKAKHSHN